jgi:hypothetical protein
VAAHVLQQQAHGPPLPVPGQLMRFLVEGDADEAPSSPTPQAAGAAGAAAAAGLPAALAEFLDADTLQQMAAALAEADAAAGTVRQAAPAMVLPAGPRLEPVVLIRHPDHRRARKPAKHKAASASDGAAADAVAASADGPGGSGGGSGSGSQTGSARIAAPAARQGQKQQWGKLKPRHRAGNIVGTILTMAGRDADRKLLLHTATPALNLSHQLHKFVGSSSGSTAGACAV